MMFELEPVLNAQREWQIALASGEPRLKRFAMEALKRCSDAVAILSTNLNEIGYRWVSIDSVAEDRLNRNITLIEEAIGSFIPDILVLFWKQVGGVAFVDLENYQHVRFWKDHKLSGPAGYCDGLFVQACSEAYSRHVCEDFIDWQDYRTPDAPEGYLLSLSPDGYHKDNISGGAPYGLIPGEPWKPVWQYFEWSGYQRPISAGVGPPDFLSYLRTAILECAGFPAFLGLPDFHGLRERLLKGVPIF